MPKCDTKVSDHIWWVYSAWTYVDAGIIQFCQLLASATNNKLCFGTITNEPVEYLLYALFHV